MKNKFLIFNYLLTCLVLILFLSGCGKSNANESDKKDKVVQELDYLDTQIITIANNLNNITSQNYMITSEEISLEEAESSSSGEQSEGSSQKEGDNSESNDKKINTTKLEAKSILASDKNEINWDNIKNEIEIINEAWSVVILDLSSMNVDNNDILAFSTALDDTILSIRNENKTDTLSNISKLYSYIPRFERGISAENGLQNVKQVKSYLLNAYSLIEQDDWIGIQTNVYESENTFKNIANDMEYMRNREYKVNRTYVLLKELQNSLAYRDKDLFYIKYRNLMESINTL